MNPDVSETLENYRNRFEKLKGLKSPTSKRESLVRLYGSYRNDPILLDSAWRGLAQLYNRKYRKDQARLDSACDNPYETANNISGLENDMLVEIINLKLDRKEIVGRERKTLEYKMLLNGRLNSSYAEYSELVGRYAAEEIININPVKDRLEARLWRASDNFVRTIRDLPRDPLDGMLGSALFCK